MSKNTLDEPLLHNNTKGGNSNRNNKNVLIKNLPLRHEYYNEHGVIKILRKDKADAYLILLASVDSDLSLAFMAITEGTVVDDCMISSSKESILETKDFFRNLFDR